MFNIDGDVLKILAICVSVFMGFIAILLNNHCARKREDDKRRKDKVEALYVASIEYYEAVNTLFNDYLKLKKQRGQLNVRLPDISNVYPNEEKADIKPFRLAIHKLEMLFGLYFKDTDFNVDEYDLRSFPVIMQMLNDWSPHSPPNYSSTDDLYNITRENTFKNKEKLINICHKLMAENETQIKSKWNPL